MESSGQVTDAPGAVTEPKKKRTLPTALAAHRFQKGHVPKNKKRTDTPTAASPKVASAAANVAAVTTRRVGLVEWLWS